LGERRGSLAGRCLAFSPDGETLALGWDWPMVRRWEVTSGRELLALPGKLSHVLSVAISPDGKTLAATGNFGSTGLWLWDLASRRVRASFPESVAGMAFSPDGRVLATGGSDGSLRFRNGTDGRLLGTYRWHQSAIDAVAFSPDGRWLATGGKEDRVKLWPVDALLGLKESVKSDQVK
jgi:WD40 repeat protein